MIYLKTKDFRHYLVDAGIGQTAFARLAGLHAPELSRVAHGGNASAQTVARVILASGRTFEELFEIDEAR